MCMDWDQAQLDLIYWLTDDQTIIFYMGFGLAQPYGFNLSLAHTTWSQP
jgi:hypothetical protein